MANLKGQGLPLSFIVIAAISVLILVIIVAVTIGPGGGLLKQLVTPAPEELSTVQVACNTYCSQLVSATTGSQFQASPFCTKTFAIDINKDGKINSTDEAGLHCWGNKLKVTCTVQIGGTTYTEQNCTNYSPTAK
jgi:hypothetical protein